MDLELLEALALSDDRSDAIAQLLPGSEDADYFQTLQLQHRGTLDEADRAIAAWPGRHGHTERYARILRRQQLCRLAVAPGAVADQIRDAFGVDHEHQPEADVVDPTLPTRLEGYHARDFLDDAYGYDSNLSQVTDEGLYQLLALDLDPSRRRALLGRIGHTSDPALLPHVARDLASNPTFGSLQAHRVLTLAQLDELAGQRPALRADVAWVQARVQRMRPTRWVELEVDRAARLAYLEALWAFVRELPAAINSLKVHVLWHLLDTLHRLDRDVDPDLLRAYLSLPRVASYVSQRWIDRVKRDDVARLGVDFSAATGLPATGDDEALVRALLARHLDDAERYAEWLERGWLDQEIATARLLAGSGDLEQATRILGPSRAAALRERVELAWCAHNPTRFALDEAIGVDVDVKHVSELVVKVFRIDPLAYFQRQPRAVGPELDLDGLAASHEQVIRLDAPAIRRVRRRIELPMCARAGTYVVDLIGNGISSRAVIVKGRLRFHARLGAAGHVVTILDESGAPRPDARAWIGDREYTPDARGAVLVPFSTREGETPMLLACGDLATVASLRLFGESYALALELLIDRQSVTAGRPAKALARLAMTVGGAPASVALLEKASWEVTLVDRAGVSTTKSQPLVPSDDDATVLEWPLGEDVARVAIAVRGTVKVLSRQTEQEVSQSRVLDIATMHGEHAVDTAYLAETRDGYVSYALGKNGEPRAHRPAQVSIRHRWALGERHWSLGTDARGRVELGALPGATEIRVDAGSGAVAWAVGDLEVRGAQAIADGRDALVVLPPSRDAGETIAGASLVELRGGVPARHVAGELIPLAGGIVVRGLPPGEYQLRAPGIREYAITVAPVVAQVGEVAIAPTTIVPTPALPPAIAKIAVGEDLRIDIRDATAKTRAHVIATRFFPAPAAPITAHGRIGRGWFDDRAAPAVYMSGRELGDEYRYILERKRLAKFPTLQLDKPPLLLDPWARAETTTEVQNARPQGYFGAGAPGMAAPAPMQRSRSATGSAANADARATYDFLADPPIVLANLPIVDGTVRVPLVALGDATSVQIVLTDGEVVGVRRIALPEPPLATRDRRLLLALDPARHARQAKQIQALLAGERLVIDDLATAKLHLIDSVERAHAYLLALGNDPTLREFAFVARWHALLENEQRALYSKYACHELHLFLYFRDRPFFDAVIAPSLANKRTKTFVDHYLLGHDLAPWLERLAELTAVEQALLAQRLPADDGLPRVLDDAVAIQPPDPRLDTRIIDALIDAAALDGDEQIEQGQREAQSAAGYDALMVERGGGGPPPAPPMASMAMPKSKKASEPKRDEMEADYDRRREAAPMFRVADATQEWAENNWWHQRPGQLQIAPNRLWRALAVHRGGPFLSRWLGLATGSFAEAMCALAVTDLPFVAGAHAIVVAGNRLEIVAAGHALAGTSQLVDGELVAGAPLVVGTSYVRHDDREDYVDGESVPKHVTAFATGVIYTCQVVLANPTSARQRIAALVQIPRGSLPVAGAPQTRTIDVALEPYGTHGHEYSFYFPTEGSYAHFPVHVSRGDAIIAAAPATRIEVTSGGAAPDPRSWPALSQHGSLGDVVAYLATANLAAIELDKIAWRLRDRAAYDAILGALETRRAYLDALWGYALYHRDLPRIGRWLRTSSTDSLGGGPVLEMFALDAERHGNYEHLELAPLINARAHRLGAKLRVPNTGLAKQYRSFLELVAHRPKPTSEDLLAAAHYLLAQDRVAPALAMLGRVGEVAEQLQRDYLAAYAACLSGDPARARSLAEPHRDTGVDRWRARFAALLAMLDELTGADAQVSDAKSRDQQQAELATRQPAFELAVDRDGAIVHSQHVASLELRYFEMDVELLFSRQPFVQSDVSRFSFIEPGHRETIAPDAETRVPWPAALRGKNVVVEAVGAGVRKAKVHYANDLAVNLAHQYGQVRVQRASDRSALPSTYVKCYARKHDGTVAFYKDGYTDLRGWFDYASLSTDELDGVAQFAILVASELAGAAILEANPPAR